MKPRVLMAVLACLFCSGAISAQEISLGDKSDAIKSGFSSIREAQTAAEESQMAALVKLGFTPEQAARAIDLQQQAKKAQLKANEAQGRVEWLVHRTRHLAGEINGWANRREGDLKRAEEMQGKIEAGEARLKKLEADLESAKVKRKEAEETYQADTKNKDKRRAMHEARSNVSKIERKIKETKHSLGWPRKEYTHRSKQAIKMAELCAPRYAEIRTIRNEKLPAAVAEAAEAEREAIRLQEAALQALENPESSDDKADEAADSSTDKNAESASTSDTTAQEEAQPNSQEPSDSSKTATSSQSSIASSTSKGQSTAALYESALATEKTITDKYVDARAAELAMISKVSKDIAKSRIDVPEAQRASVNASVLDGSASTPSQMDAFRQEANKALDQMDAMVNRGRELLATAGYNTEGATEFSLAYANTTAEVARALEATAVDESGAAAKDLTGLMQAAYDAGTSGSSNSGSAGSASGASAGQTGSQSAIGAAGLPSGPNPFESANTDIKPIKSGWVPGVDMDVKPMYKAIPGRRIQAGLGGAEWMYIDSWYMIGPFPNSGRRYKEIKFPPETVVDLDAVYQGIDGKPVTWEFVNSGDPVIRFTESYAIYYAYTEIWIDEARDMWVALGADDGSRLYINDLLIWRTTELKAWRINEAYRKVSFKKGLNRILYRVENAPVHGWFSFLIRVQEPQTQTNTEK